MILSDRAIEARIGELLPHHHDHVRVNPASIDLTIGGYVLFEPFGMSGNWRPESLMNKGSIRLGPGEVVLVSTEEHIYIPPDLAGEIRLKSSRAREGYNMGNAGYVDPGWNGVLTFQVTNSLSNCPLFFKHLQPFFQLILHQLDAPAAHLYNGKYQHAKRVEGAK